MEMILMFLVLGVFILGILKYNNIVVAKQAVIASEKEISVQLDRRGKVFDNLINTVKKYLTYENETLTKIVELRNSCINKSNVEVSKQAENELSKIISSGQLSSSLNLTMEAYPELKSSTNMLQLQEEIVSTENKLSFSKKAYNNSVEYYNTLKEKFPDLFLFKMFNDLNVNFKYWELDEDKKQKEEERRVEF